MNEYSWFNLPSRVWSLEQGGGGSATIPTGTDRQVLGYVDGAPEAVTLGWKQFSDLPTAPTFSNGVLTGTAFNEDGDALFAFIELNTGSTFKSTTIPMYSSTGTLPVATGTGNNDAVNLSQLNAAVATLTARIEALENA